MSACSVCQVCQDPAAPDSASQHVGEGETHPPVYAWYWGWETLDWGEDATSHIN